MSKQTKQRMNEFFFLARLFTVIVFDKLLLLRSKYYKTWPHHKKKKNRFIYRAQYRLEFFKPQIISYFLQVLFFDDFFSFLSTITVDQKVKMGEKKMNKIIDR